MFLIPMFCLLEAGRQNAGIMNALTQMNHTKLLKESHTQNVFFSSAVLVRF